MSSFPSTHSGNNSTADDAHRTGHPIPASAEPTPRPGMPGAPVGRQGPASRAVRSWLRCAGDARDDYATATCPALRLRVRSWSDPAQWRTGERGCAPPASGRLPFGDPPRAFGAAERFLSMIAARINAKASRRRAYYWQQTRDRLFLMFAGGFLTFAVSRLILAFLDEDDEGRVFV